MEEEEHYQKLQPDLELFEESQNDEDLIDQSAVVQNNLEEEQYSNSDTGDVNQNSCQQFSL